MSRNAVAPSLALGIALSLLTGCFDQGSSSSSSSEDAATDPAGEDFAPQTVVPVDWHNQKTPTLQPGEFDLLTLSTLPDTVTGGDVLVGVRGLDEDDSLTLLRNGDDVSDVMSFDDDLEMHTGLVEGLHEGENELTAIVEGPQGDRAATLDVTNHPITGPVISGPHQDPFECRTERAGLGEPIDENCSAETQFQWFYRAVDQSFNELEDPHSDYPRDMLFTQTSEGERVPYVVRVETATINRGIARLAVLDDPANREPDDPFEPEIWNGRMYYVYGESCGVGFSQGNSSPELVLGGFPDPTELGEDNLLITLAGVSDRLSQGDIVAHNTLSSFGVHCNPLISIETTMMMKEHVIEQYGMVRSVLGTNGSGGALQQFNAANNAPGLINGGLPTATFADIPSTAMTVADCGLLQSYYRRDDVDLNQFQQAAINGHNMLSGNSLNAICDSWEDTFLSRIDPTSGCVSSEERYHPEDNPDGVRCTIQDANVNIFGTDPETGFARRPLDNAGVQYGLSAFNRGHIDFDEFLQLNRDIGGFDIDGNIVDERMRMDPEVEAITYKIGGVIGRGALAETPFIDLAAYLDLIPVANIHEAVRPFTIRERLRPRAGGGDTHSIFRGVLTQPDVFPVMDKWMERIEESDRAFGASPVKTVLDSKPLSARDRCSFGTIGGRLALPEGFYGPLGLEAPVVPTVENILGLSGVDQLLDFLPGQDVAIRVDVPEDFSTGLGPCSIALPVTENPRIAAGGPLSDDVIRCQKKPIDPSDYNQSLSNEQLMQLQEVFPNGVCDYDKPAEHDVEQSILWPSVGSGDTAVEPFGLEWRAARGQLE